MLSGTSCPDRIGTPRHGTQLNMVRSPADSTHSMPRAALRFGSVLLGHGCTYSRSQMTTASAGRTVGNMVIVGVVPTLAARVVTALDLPATLNEDPPTFDKYCLQSDPRLLRDVASSLAALIPSEVEVLAGVELGGVPLAAAVSLHDGRPLAIVRHQPKNARGRIAGAEVLGRRVAVIKDMTRGGGALISAAHALRAAGAVVCDAICVISWDTETVAVLASSDLILRPVLTLEDLRLVWQTR